MLWGQTDTTAADTLHFTFEPESLELKVGETAKVKITLLDKDGEPSNNAFFVYGGRRGSLSTHPRLSDSTGVALVTVKAFKPGKQKLSVRSITTKREDRQRAFIPVKVAFPPLEKIVFIDPPVKMYVGTTLPLSLEVIDAAGLTWGGLEPGLTSSSRAVASLDRFYNVTARKVGKVTITAQVEGVKSTLRIKVVKNPTAGVKISSTTDQARTGDVVRFTAVAKTRSGRTVKDAPISYSFTGTANYGIGLPASGQISGDGRFVAETAGLYTIRASSGGFTVSQAIKIVPRNIRKRAKLVGHGLVKDVYTSDLWIWSGVGKFAGRDFAVTGTWSANGEAYFWEVTDPENITLIDTVKVDARTVNDVKVSEDGRIAVISREGASNRKNGFVILDVSDPFNVEILSTFDHDMTGGVHNVFIYDDHVYGVNNGRKFDVINIADPTKPYRVGIFELDTPNHSIHDVWIEHGIAYSSNWHDGVQAIDVGGLTRNEMNKPLIDANPLLKAAGRGSPGMPVQLASMPDTTGRNHAAFPFLSQSTGKFYIIAGDESFPAGVNLNTGGLSKAAGGFHFIDFSDPANPHEVALYQVPEAGSHNLWVQGDTLYAAFYQGGFRVLDISGELMGDLYKQGREIASYLSESKEGMFENAAMVWGPQPHKGLIYFSDMHSGLYAIRLVPLRGAGTN